MLPPYNLVKVRNTPEQGVMISMLDEKVLIPEQKGQRGILPAQL